MDQSYSDSDVSLSPSALLKRLQELSQKRLEYHDSPETTSSVTELVSHFSNSTSYNTFRSLLQSTEASNEIYADTESAGGNVSTLCQKDNIHINMDGVSVLNLSNVSEPPDTPASSKSSARRHSEREKSSYSESNSDNKKQICLDEMPIHSSKINFETLVVKNLNKEKAESKVVPNSKPLPSQKRQFLKRGEGLARFGIQKKSFVIQNTRSLPWRDSSNISNKNKVCKLVENKIKAIENEKMKSNVKVDKPQNIPPLNKTNLPALNKQVIGKKTGEFQKKSDSKETKQLVNLQDQVESVINSKSSCTKNDNSSDNVSVKAKYTGVYNEKPSASVLTTEQGDFLRQLKQSSYYKNFVSPIKSIAPDLSCDENYLKLQQEKETTEQNMFELLEKKTANESFNLNNSLLLKQFLMQNSSECSGESTPIVMQKCLSKNPNLMHLLPEVRGSINETTSTDAESCYTECLDCNACCSSASECNSCKTCSNFSIEIKENKEVSNKNNKDVIIDTEKEYHKDSMNIDTEAFNNMVEMNAKLNASREFLKDRLLELEHEIETFRKENAKLKKIREDIELERQKFYEEKSTFEQKFNEEKVLSEYYLAEEKEKLNKQKQIYERYVKDMRGRLKKKEEDEVINLKKEIVDLKEEIRSKDAKSTSTIAKLRNQLRIIEKEKKNLEEEIEKLKKENRRIQHSNDITRRMTNIKYLEEINKKLNKMASKDAHSELEYKANEMEQQNKPRKFIPISKDSPTRAISQSQPNLNLSKSAISPTQTNYDKLTPHHSSKSPNSMNQENYKQQEYQRSQSPESILSNKSSSSQKCDTVINKETYINPSIMPSPEPVRKSSLTKTNLNPTEIRKPDGTKEIRFPNGNIKTISADRQYSKFVYYNGDIKENFYNEGRVKYYYAESKTINTMHPDGLEVLELPDGQVEKRYPDGSSEIRFPNGSIHYVNPKNEDIREEWRYPDGSAMTISAKGEKRIMFANGQIEVYTKEHKRREFPDGTVKLVYNDGTSETRYSSGRVRIKDKHGNLIMDSTRQ